jgi:hypothetical protein
MAKAVEAAVATLPTRKTISNFRFHALAKWTGLAVMLAGSTFLLLASIASLALESETPGNVLGVTGIVALLGSLGIFFWLDRRMSQARSK